MLHSLATILEVDRRDATKVSALLGQACRFRRRFLDWAESYSQESGIWETSTLPHGFEGSDPVGNHLDVLAFGSDISSLARALFWSIASCPPLDIGPYGNVYGWMMIINRTIMSLCEHHRSHGRDSQYEFSCPSFYELEEKNMQLADLAFHTEEYLRSSRPVGLLYYKFSLDVAHATYSTTDEWSSLDKDQKLSKQPVICADGLADVQAVRRFLDSIHPVGNVKSKR